MPELKCLTTKDVARLCRVSTATVKRWEESGLIQSERTSGGHRRFRAEEVARFQLDQNLGLKQSHGDESLTKAITRRREKTFNFGSALLQALLSGCEEAVSNILINEYLNGKALTDIFDELFCPAMREIGDLWFRGEISITQEHLASRIAQNAIYKLRSKLLVTNAPENLAICCAFEGDYHELPTNLAQITLENEGWEVLNFGANTPLYSLTDEVLQNAPKLVCISAVFMNDVERLSRDFKEFSCQLAKNKIPVLLGGRVFDEQTLRHRFPADKYAQKLRDVSDFAAEITRQNRS